MQKKANRSSTPAPHDVLGKNLPVSIEAERSLLGAILLNEQHINTVSEILLKDDFYSHAHRLIYGAILAISESGRHIDVITLQDELEKDKSLDAIGGFVYLMSLQEDVSALGLVAQHAKIVKEKAVLRELITSASRIITNCYEQNDAEIETVLDEAEKTIFDISNKRSNQSFVQLDIWLKRTFQHLSEMTSHRSGITGIPTRYHHLDDLTSGLQAGDLVVLAARPSMGKTALALSVALHAAQEGYRVGLFSLEMSAEQLTLRLLSGESRIRHHSIRNATINSDEWMDLTNAAARLAEKKLFIDDTAMQSITDIRAKVRKLQAEHGLDFIVIDYLQLLRSTKRFENRHQEVSEISRSLKALAKELNIPVMALSQLSRAVDSRVDKRPMLSDLRESGAIEQDADLIMFLYRDVVYNPDTEEPGMAELIVGKQRNGPTGTVNLYFDKELTVFEDMQE
jgi:replicative DNA helicase